MKLSLSQIRQITTGAVRIEEVEDAIQFFRFTREQEELYKNRSDSFYMKTFATSGVQMRFRTDSRSIFLNVDTEMGSTRRYFSLEVFVNGERIGAIKNFSEEALFGDFTKWEFPLGNFSGQFDLGEGEKEVRIYFPWSVKVALKAFVLDEGSFVIPVKPCKQLLCFGDSISHGYDVLFPSNKYLTKLADLLDAEEHNKAIGGEIYFPELAKTKEDFEPDYIIVEYGSNDWSRCTQEALAQNSRAFLCNVSQNYPNAKIFVTTPIWREDLHANKPFGDFMRAGEIIREQAAGLDNISVIWGFDFVPQDESLFADLRLHPNDKGYEYFLESLWKGIKDSAGGACLSEG